MKKMLKNVLSIVIVAALTAGIFTGCDTLGNTTLIVEKVYIESVRGWTVSKIVLYDELKKENVEFVSNDPAKWFENVESGTVGDGAGLQAGLEGDKYYMTAGEFPLTVTIEMTDYTYKITNGYKFAAKKTGDSYQLMMDKTNELNR